MQMNNKDYVIKRLLSYWAKIYNKKLKVGDSYTELTRSICIMFINENIGKLKDLEALTSWKIIEEKGRKTILTNDLQLCIIEIPKAKKEGTNKELLKWIEFLENPKGEQVQKMKERYEEIEEAIKKWEEITADEELMSIIEARQRYYLDMNTAKVVAREEGLEEGRAKGRAEGVKESTENIVKQMLKLRSKR